ncbi:hypothetical protein K432DRAFT_276424, partial [Lepidopterella palustris CBS 459.81]
TLSPVTLTTSASGGQEKPIISPDRRCGGPKGYICKGSSWRSCCNVYDYCGDSNDYRTIGCRPEFGDCD